MATFSEFLSSLDPDAGKRGKQFEHFVKWFLKNDPEWSTQVDQVWLWDEYPESWGRDCGIDLVFKHKNGENWAVQAKCYSPTTSITKADVDSERTVVLSEISVRDDDPSDYIHELFLETMYGDTPLGRSILGTVDSINGMSRTSLFNYYKKHYRPAELVVSVAGNVKHKQVVKMVEAALSRDNFLDVPAQSSDLRSTTPVKTPGLGKVGIIDRKTEQAHILYGFPGLARTDKRRFAMSILASAIGGGMSSRLFQEIREKRGLAYTTYAYPQQFAGTGTIAFYAGCRTEKAEEVIALMREVAEQVAAHGLTDEEISRAKGAVTGSLVLGQEDTGSRMTRIGKSELVYGEIMSFDEILKAVRSVTAEEVHQLARDLFTQPATLGVVGPFRSTTKFEKVIR